MQVIDVHCHIYPGKIAARAVSAVGDFYGIPMDIPYGTSEGLLSATSDSLINRFVVHSVATRAEQVTSINDFILGECAAHPEFTGFMTLHQDMTDDELESEIDRCEKLGLVGIKLHPDTQRINMDDPKLMRIYEIAAGRLPMIIHCGDYRYDFSHPRRLKRILHDFPNLTVDAAHFGGWSIYDLAVEYLENENCYMDMSSSIALLGMRRTEELTRIYGTDRIMFGSDFPMWDPVSELDLFTKGNWSDDELEQLLSGNALRFLGKA